MRATEFLSKGNSGEFSSSIRESVLEEGLSHPVICVDVQPEYANFESPFADGGALAQKCAQIAAWVSQQTGPVLMFVNAENSGVSNDTIPDIVEYWEEVAGSVDWNRFTIIDKGYGYFRSWMDYGIPESVIIRVIREMYNQRQTDSRMLFNGDHDQFKEWLGGDYDDLMEDEGLTTKWTSIAQLRRFSGAYIVGGGRNECLREVELLMNAFNIRYRRVDSLVYG